MTLNTNSSLYSCFPAWSKFFSSHSPPGLDIPYIFAVMHPSNRQYLQEGTKCSIICNLFTCVWHSALLNFPHWPLCNFTSSLMLMWLLLKTKPLPHNPVTPSHLWKMAQSDIPQQVILFALGRHHELSNLSCLWDWISIGILLSSN